MVSKSALSVWFLAWLLLVVSAVWGTYVWRNGMMEYLQSPEPIAEWQAYQQEMAREVEEHAPVQHKVSLRPEPPLLVWLRERLAVILFAVVLFTTIFYGMVMFLVRGLWPKKTEPEHPEPK